MSAAYDAPCGQRAVITQGNVVEYDVPGPGLGIRDPGGYMSGGYMSGTCVVPKRDRHVEHRDADGRTWIESVR